MKQIKITCKGADLENLENLQHLQGNLKELTEENYVKLKKEIETEGFSFPFFIWVKNENEKYLMDGHQRHKVLTRMQKEGYEIPLLPVDHIEADNEEHAKTKLLAILSQYGKVTEEGLYQFIESIEINTDEVFDRFRLPEIKTDSFMENFYEDINFEPVLEDEQGKLDEKNKKICPKCGFEFD